MAKGTGSSQMQTEDYLDIEAQIQKELDALKVEDLEEFGEEDDLQLGPFSASAQLNSFDKDIDKVQAITYVCVQLFLTVFALRAICQQGFL